MKIVTPYARILAPPESGYTMFTIPDGLNLLRRIEWSGRISHRSEDAMTQDSYQRFIRTVVLEHGDWSIVEHATVSVDMLVDRGITHEIVRHRLFSYTQESTRFVNYEKKMPPSFIYPKPDVRCEICLEGNDFLAVNTDEIFVHSNNRTCSYDYSWIMGIRLAEESYKDLLAKGWRPQEARSVFPNALASRIIITGNLRNWRHFFLMRTSKEAHPQMREVTIPLLEEFQTKIPILFEDIEPNARQIDNLKKGR